MDFDVQEFLDKKGAGRDNGISPEGMKKKMFVFLVDNYNYT